MTQATQKKVTRQVSMPKKPLTKESVSIMHNTDLSATNFQRIARNYFKTYRLANLVTLIHPTNGKSVKVDFNKDPLGYHKISVYKDGKHVFNVLTKLTYNKDVYIKILRHNLL